MFLKLKKIFFPYQEYLKNKNVIIVGPAAYLKDFENGSFIDSFDVVVRINRGIELLDLNSKNLGTKTDILYNCLIETPENGGELNIELFKKKNVKWISTIPNSTKEGFAKNMKLHPLVDTKSVRLLKKNFKFHVMDYKLYNNVNRNVNSRSNTGYAAIFDLLNYHIKSLYITGFSFYLDDFFNGYKSGSKINEKEFALKCFNSTRHQQKPQWEYLKKIILQNKIIKTDKILDEILLMKNFSREDFNLK
jgi:hypothetical protein